MSLHQLAQAVQSRGRGEDTVLIHMTPKEVGGLQALAMANGGSLTTNPDTGLPEAGFLSNLLPTLIGAGLSFVPGVGPLMAAGLVGGGTALLTGNLQKGLMAGLGAYGGAGFGQGLLGAGAAAAQQGAMQGVTPTAVAPAATSAANALPAFDPITGAWVNEGMASGAANAQAQAAAQAMADAQSQAAIGATKEFLEKPWYEQAGAGIKALGTESGRDMALQSMGGGKQAMKFGLAAALPMMQVDPRAPEPIDDERYLYQYNRRPYEGPRTGPYTSEQRYFTDDTLTRIPGYAEGGETEPYKMTGASKEAFDYLMGRAETSPSRAAAQEVMVASAATPVAVSTAPPKQKQAPFTSGFWSRSDASPTYRYDPRTGGLTAIALPEAELTPIARRPRQERGGNYGTRGGYAGPSGGLNNSAGHGYGDGTSFAAKGGLISLARGGLASGGFVIPADVVSMLGEGSTDAGIRALRAKFGEVKAIKGPGTGQSDSIKTTIEGRQPARVADGEAYIPPEVVQQHGGAKKFYAMLSKVRAASQGHTKQQRRVNPDRVLA